MRCGPEAVKAAIGSVLDWANGEFRPIWMVQLGQCFCAFASRSVVITLNWSAWERVSRAKNSIVADAPVRPEVTDRRFFPRGVSVRIALRRSDVLGRRDTICLLASLPISVAERRGCSTGATPFDRVDHFAFKRAEHLEARPSPL